jgi:hypothetical protein
MSLWFEYGSTCSDLTASRIGALAEARVTPAS